MAFLEKEMMRVVAFMRKNGVTHYHVGEVELTLHPSALEVSDGNDWGEDKQPVHYQDAYDDPMLYPDGKDPIAEQREWQKKQEGLSQ